MILCAPVSGKLIPMTEVPDPVFAEKMLGDGFAIESREEKKDIVVSPVNGTIKNVNENNHALIIETDDKVEVLIHVGVDTVALKGKGFKPLVKAGKKVSVGDRLLKIDLQFIRSQAPSSMIIVVLANQPNVVVKLPHTNNVQAEDVVFSLTNGKQDAAYSDADARDVVDGEWIEIINPHGLHARPSATLAKKVLSYSVPVWVEKQGGRRVDAKSSTAIMSMGLAKGDKVRFACADVKIIQALNQAVREGLGEDAIESGHPVADSSALSQAQEKQPHIANEIFHLDFNSESRLKLPVASPGITWGRLFIVKEMKRDIPVSGKDAAEEKKTLVKAVEKAISDLNSEIIRVDAESAEILEAHKAFLMDPELLDLSSGVIDTGKSASFAWNQVTNEQAEIFAQSGNAYMAERAADMRDINNRILDILLGKLPAPQYPDNCIVLVHELTPSDVTNFDPRIKGVVSVVGSPTSHASIMLRNRGIPSFYQAPEEIMYAPEGIEAVLDTEQGFFLVNPNAQEKGAYKTKIEQIDRRKAEALAVADKRGETKDGVRIEITGNVSSIKEAKEATSRGGEGFGLARSEFLFYGRQTAPSEDEQRDLYQGLLAATTHMVTVRLLDAGGDKPLAYVKIAKEANPQLGVRGMRIIEDNEDVYRTQIRALLRCKDLDRLRIMTPMISLVSEVARIAKIVEEEKNRLGIMQMPQLGIMAETPAVCIMSEQFAPHVDFFSVGTNDLTQYTMAMDRENSRLAPLASAANPAVLGMIYHLCQGAEKFSKPVAVCGAAASDPLTACLFVGLGVTELASSAETLPEVKAAVRSYTLKQLKDVSLRAMRSSSEEEVRKIVKRELNI